MKISSQNIIITGASDGIGREIALEFAKPGNKIAINSFQHPDKLNEVKKEIVKRGAQCIMSCGDIGDYYYAGTFINEIIDLWQHVDLLVNNAGISYIGLLTDMTIEQWNKIVATNLTSVFNTCNHLIPYMVKEKSGCIINTSSVWGNAGASCEVAYSATKGGINAFTKALAKELAPSGIKVNAIAYGAIATKMNSCFTSEELAALCDEIPIGRLGLCSEAAEIVKLIYQSPIYLTGEVITMDGGWL